MMKESLAAHAEMGQEMGSRAELIGHAIKHGAQRLSTRLQTEFWRYLQQNLDQKQAYIYLGKSFAAQRAFKVKWLQDEFKAIKRDSTYQESNEETENLTIKYSNVSQLIWRFKSRAAALNWVTHALKLHVQGVQIRGRPMLRYNEWTKTWDFIDIEEEYLMACGKTYVMRETALPKQLEDTPASSSDTAKCSRKHQLPDPQENPVHGKAAKPKASATPQGAEKKQLSKAMNELEALENRTQQAMSKAQEYEKAIAEQDAWKDLQPWSARLLGKRQAIDSAKTNSDFWVKWAMLTAPALAAHVKGLQFAEVVAEMSHKKVIEQAVEDLEKLLKRVEKVKAAATEEWSLEQHVVAVVEPTFIVLDVRNSL